MHNKALDERTIYNERTKLCHSYYAADYPGHTPKIVTALQVVGSPGHTQKIVTALGYWLSGPYAKNCHSSPGCWLSRPYSKIVTTLGYWVSGPNSKDCHSSPGMLALPAILKKLSQPPCCWLSSAIIKKF